MEDSSKKSGVDNGQSLPPPYPGNEQDMNRYPGGMQQGIILEPKNTGRMQVIAAETVVQTQSVVRVPNNPNPPLESYMGCSIFVLIFCCLPFGIVALVYASQQNSKQAAGDLIGARNAQSQAKCWSYAGFFTGLVLEAAILLWVFLVDPNYYY